MTTEDRSKHCFAEGISAIFWGFLSAVAAFFLIVLASVPIGLALSHMGLLTNEGGAWVGISVGIPCGIVGAVLAFLYTLRHKLKQSGPK
ncbi:MAG: hypothetical protein WAL71_12650 [Terriglobales bacterium]